jgi:hypothetical protein
MDLQDILTLPTVDNSVPGFTQNPRAVALLKYSTNAVCMDKEIEALEAAELAMAEGETTFSIDSRCKLPLYLQEAGRGDEAVQKLVKLLEEYPPSWGKELRRDRFGMVQGHIERARGNIYGKLRLVLQRDSKFRKALPYATLAETYSKRIDTRIYQYLLPKWEGKPKQGNRTSFCIICA